MATTDDPAHNGRGNRPAAMLYTVCSVVEHPLRLVAFGKHLLLLLAEELILADHETCS